MALVTIQRSPSPSTQPDEDSVDSSDDVGDGKSQMRKRSRTSKEKLRKIFSSVRFISKLRPCLSESYFTVKGAALILPHTECTKKLSKKSHGGEIQNHLQAMLRLLRPMDTIKIAVRLENINQYQRYIALVSTKGRQDTEEAVVLGIDCSGGEACIGLTLPVWMGLQIKLGGDGGFSLCTDEQSYLFKPVSVQAMWSAIQSLVKVQHIAEDMKYMRDGLSHTWVDYYRSSIDRRDSARMNLWNIEGVEVFAPSSLSVKGNDGDNERIKLTISQTLKEVMMTVDLDEATSVMLRTAVEEKMNMSLAEFKSYFDEEVIRILGQMDEPSEILEFLYLGSEWNASNLEELTEKGIAYILNVTKEIDNFFEGSFHYYNVRVVDQEDSDLLKHWDKTYKFISKARSQRSKVLVHCKMGVSRSAATVMAFIMKDRRLTVDEAFQFVKARRSCVHPNSGFMEQLQTYEGILSASNKRDVFRCKSDQNLLDEGTTEETEPIKDSFLGDSLFHMTSHSDWLSASGGVAHEEEWIHSLDEVDQAFDSDFIQMDTDLEMESRSADSMEEFLPDLPSPPPDSTAVSCTAHETPASPLDTAPSSTVPVFDPDIHSELDSPLGNEPDMSLDASQDTGSSQLQTSLVVLGSRIKPDSSWIRLDLEELNDGSHAGDDTLPSNDSTGYTQPSYSAPDVAAPTDDETVMAEDETLEHMDISEESGIIPAAATVPESMPYTPVLQNNSPSSENASDGKIKTCAQFYIGSKRNSMDKSSPTFPAIGVSSPDAIHEQSASFSSFVPLDATERKLLSSATDQTAKLDLQTEAVSQEPADQIQHQKPDMQQRGEPAGSLAPALNKVTVIPEAEGKDSSGLDKTGSSFDRAELSVPHFVQDQVPEEMEKVKKMQNDVNKMELMPQSEDDVHDEHKLISQLLEHQPSSSMHHSHSCMELFSEEGQSVPMSVYEREKIPLSPGTVLRTRLQMEERQKLFCGEGDQEVFSSIRPVFRTSSLKQREDSPRSKYTQSRRLTCAPIMSPLPGKSLDDLRTVGLSEVKLTGPEPQIPSVPHQTEAMSVDTDHEPEADAKSESDKKSPRVISRLDFTSSIQISDASTDQSAGPSLLDGELTYKAAEECTSGDNDGNVSSCHDGACGEQRTVGNFSSVTLALIREIGSALSMTPNPPAMEDVKTEETCKNMVKYLVRKIEKQAKIPDPAQNVIHVEGNSRKAASWGKDELVKPKSPSVIEKDVVGRRSDAFEAVPSTVTSTNISNFPSAVRLDFPNESYILSSAKSVGRDSCRPYLDRGGHRKTHASDPVLEAQQNVVPSLLPACKSPGSPRGNKSAKSVSLFSPCSTNQSQEARRASENSTEDIDRCDSASVSQLFQPPSSVDGAATSLDVFSKESPWAKASGPVNTSVPASSGFAEPEPLSDSSTETLVKPSRPKSVDQKQHSTSLSECGSSSGNLPQRSCVTGEQGDSTEFEAVALRQVPSEGRKIQILQGMTTPEQQPREGPFDSLA